MYKWIPHFIWWVSLTGPCVCFSTNIRPRIAFPPIDCCLLVVADRLLLLIDPPTKSTMECQPTIYCFSDTSLVFHRQKQNKERMIKIRQYQPLRLFINAMLRKDLKQYNIKVLDSVTCNKCPYYYLVLYRDKVRQIIYT